MIPVRKNERYTVTGIDLTHEGMGVVKIDNYPIFVENLLPNEQATIKVIKVGKTYGFGLVETLHTTSPDRVPIIDKKGTWVGTMPLQHLSYEAQLIFKQQQVKNVLSKIAHLPNVPVYETLGSTTTTNYRNKAQIPVRDVNGQLETGFFRKNSHELVPMTNFIIQDSVIDAVIQTAKQALRHANCRSYDEIAHTGDIRHIIVRRGVVSKEVQVVFVTRTAKKLPESITQTLLNRHGDIVSILQNVNDKRTNVIMGDKLEVLFGRDYIEDELLGKTYKISAKSFYQVNPKQTEVLYTTAIQAAQLTKDDVVIDAYCGIGTIGLSLADNVKAVYGMEIVPDAIEMAKQNAEINGITNAHFEVGPAHKVMPKWRHLQPNVVIVDPPRKGLDASFIQTTIEIAPQRIVYISCNPATMARDIALFHTNGYDVEYVQPVDMFPYTTHVECVALLERQ